MKRSLCLFTLLLVAVNAAFALTGKELRDQCRWSQQDESALTPEQHLHYAACVSYVLGVADGYYLGSNGGSCVPNKGEVTSGQLGLVVFKYLDEHPEELHLHAGVLVVRALKKAFPCKG